MPLARIITDSQACSRELALDLLARGYTVEIVSPDRIPDNLADLELRVDAGPGDQLIAKVDAHDGNRLASLDFVHHLKAPMGDFIRRPIVAAKKVQDPVNLNTQPRLEEVELPPQPAPKAASSATKILRDPKPEPKNDAPRVSPPDPLPTKRPSDGIAIATSVPPPPVLVARSKPPAHPTPRAAASPWRAALTLAGIVVLASILWFGVRPRGKTSAQTSTSAAPAEKLAAGSNDLPDRPTNQSQATKTPAQDSPAAAGRAISPPHSDDVIAPDRVVYLDDRFKPAPKAKTSKRLPPRRPVTGQHHGGVIAANSVTYFKDTPAPKSAK
jgi:hypothetical protein